MSEETKKKLSDAQKGKLRTASYKAAISARQKGKARSDEARAAISDGIKAMKKAVIITLLWARVEIPCTSLANAAKEMGVRYQIISKLANKTTKKSTSKGGDHVGKLFTARFRDE